MMARLFIKWTVITLSCIMFSSQQGCRGLPGSWASKPALSETLPSGSEHAPTDGADEADLADLGRQISMQLAVARSAESSGDHAKAITAYTKVIDLAPDNTAAYYRLAVLRDRSGDPATAQELYHKAIAISPEDADIHCDLGYSYYLVGENAKAEDSFREALRLRPEFPRAHNNLAILLARSGRVDEALFQSSQAGISEQDARTNIGLALMLEGKTPAAREQLQLASWAAPTKNSRLSQLERLVAQGERLATTEPADSAATVVRMAEILDDSSTARR